MTFLKKIGYFVHSRLKTPEERETFCKKFKFTHTDFERFITGSLFVHLNCFEDIAKYFNVDVKTMQNYDADGLYPEIVPLDLFGNAEKLSIYGTYAGVVKEIRERVSTRKELDEVLLTIERYSIATLSVLDNFERFVDIESKKGFDCFRFVSHKYEDEHGNVVTREPDHDSFSVLNQNITIRLEKKKRTRDLLNISILDSNGKRMVVVPVNDVFKDHYFEPEKHLIVLCGKSFEHACRYDDDNVYLIVKQSNVDSLGSKKKVEFILGFRGTGDDLGCLAFRCTIEDPTYINLFDFVDESMFSSDKYDVGEMFVSGNIRLLFDAINICEKENNVLDTLCSVNDDDTWISNACKPNIIG